MKKIYKRTIGVVVILLAVVGLVNLLPRIPEQLTMHKIESASANPTRVTITPGSAVVHPWGTEVRPAEITDPEEISVLFDSLRIRPSWQQFLFSKCACGGNLKITVAQEKSEPFEFTVHHGGSIRIADHSGGDAHLTPDSAHELTIWLTRHGVYELHHRVQQTLMYDIRVKKYDYSVQ